MASFVTLSDSIIEENNETKLAQLVQQMIQYCSTSGKPEAVPQNLLLKLITMLNVDYMLSLKTMACALLSLLCHNDPDTKVAVVKKEVLRPIWNTCTHICRDGLPDLESSSHIRLLQYLEQMVLLLRKLSYGEAYNQFQILKAGLIKLLLQIADMQNLYFYTYHPEAVSFLRNFTKGKDLIGKVSPLVDGEKEEILSQYLKCDSNSILQSASSFVVELYDTTDKTIDVVVKEEMLKRGLAWPEIKPPLNTQKEQNQKISQSEYLVSGVEIKDIPESTDDWLDIRVSHVISPQYFMAYVGGLDTLSTVEQVQKTIAEQVDSKGVKLKKAPEPGQFVCVTLDGMGHCRGQILRVRDEVCSVYVLDHGVVSKVPWSDMYYLTKEMNLGKIPPQATLCRLKGVGPTPISNQLLANTLGALCNLCQEKYVLGGAVLTDGGMGVILPLTRVPDGKIAEKALEVLINLGKQQSLREKVASLGGLQCLIDMCHSYISGADHAIEEQVLEKCLLALNNLLYGNAANKKMFAYLKGIQALLQLESSLDDGSVKTKLMQVLRTFTGSANLRQESGDRRVGRARERIKRNTDEKDQTALLDICLASPSSLGEERGRSSSRSGRSCSRDRPIRRGRGSDSDLERKPALGSLSRDRLLQESSSDDEIYDSAARTYSSGEEAGGLPVIALPDPSKPVNTATLYELSEKNYYILDQKVSFKQDDLHELRSTRDVKKVMFKTVEKLICGFMNQGKGGHIYFGIDTNSLVQGIRISRDERDRLRVGLDDIMKRFTPVVSHAMFEVLYSPVVHPDGHDNPQTRKPVKDFCVIELSLSKAGDIFLTSDERCFLRVEGKTKSLYTQEIRELIVSREERKFKAEMERLLELGRTLRMHLGFSEASGGQCP